MEKKGIKALTYIVMVLVTLDIISTIIGLNLGLSEGNPIIAAQFDNLGPLGALLFFWAGLIVLFAVMTQFINSKRFDNKGWIRNIYAFILGLHIASRILVLYNNAVAIAGAY